LPHSTLCPAIPTPPNQLPASKEYGRSSRLNVRYVSSEKSKKRGGYDKDGWPNEKSEKDNDRGGQGDTRLAISYFF
jgi:hypothetical protein